MRKILISIIIVLFIALGYVSVMNGVQIGNFQILSMKQIEEKSQELKTKIEGTNTLIDVDYPKKIADLKTAAQKMKDAQSEYLKYTNLSTDAQILEAMGEKSYTIEFLWTKLGTHARKEGINLTFEIVASKTGANDVNDIKFTVNGSYIAITNYIYAIENDTDLNFRIENFKLLPHKNEILQGTFNVRNIAIEGNTSTQTVTTSNSQTSTNTNTVNETNTNTNADTDTNTNTQD